MKLSLSIFFIYVIIIIIIIITQIVQSEDANFITTTNSKEFSIASNWDIQRIPNSGDNAFINSELPIKKNLEVDGYLMDIQVSILFLGSNLDTTSNTTFTTYKTFKSDILWVNNGTTFLSGGNLLNSTGVFNLGMIILSECQFDSKEMYTVSEGVTAIEYSYGIAESIEINGNSVFFLNQTTFYSLNKNSSRPLYMNSTSFFQLLDSDFGTTSDFLVRGESIIYLVNSNILIQNYESNGDNSNDNLFILNDSGISLEYSTFYSEKLMIINGDSSIGVHRSNFTSINAILFDDQSLVQIQDSSQLTFYQPVFLDNNSTVLTKSNSTISIFNSIKLLKYSRMAFQDSTIIVTKSKDWTYDDNDNTSLFLFDESQIAVNSSTLLLEYASLVIVDKSKLLLNSSVAFIRNHVLMNDTTELYFHNTQVLISGSVALSNDSKFTGQGSYIRIEGSLVFNDHSLFYFNNSNILIQGSFVDYTLIHSPGGLLKSNITVDGIYVNMGIFVLVESNLICNNEFLSNGGSSFNDASITINNGNFRNYGAVHVENSNITINEGSLLFYSLSFMTCLNSSITIIGGTLIMEPLTLLNLTNTIIYNKHGSLNARGDIYIDVGSGLINGGNLILNSNILLKNNSTNSGYEKVINQGIFEIKNNYTQTSSNSSNSGGGGDGSDDVNGVSNIYLPFYNSGSIDISKITNIKSLTQEGSGRLNLLLANSTLVIQDNFSTDLNSSITITVDNLNSSLISIQNQFINNNSSLIIRVDINRIQEKNNTIIEWSDNSGVGFNSIQFKSYDPSTGEEKDINDSCHQVYKSSNSLSVLISNGCKSSSSLSKGQIVGIVVGIVGFAAVVGCILYFKKSLYYNFIYNIKQQVNIKLASRK